MKSLKIKNFFRRDKIADYKDPNIPQNSNTKIRPLKRLATKIKKVMHKHFPKRIWPKPQENKKGPKF